MKKTLIALTFGLAALISVPVSAQNESTCPKQQCETACKEKKECKEQKECCKKQKDCKEQKECCKKQKCKKERKGACQEGQRRNPMFEGITLTAEQQQQIDKLNADRKAACKAAREQKKAERCAARDQYESDLAKILTPEQMTQFRQNKERAKAKMAGKCPKNNPKGCKEMRARQTMEAPQGQCATQAKCKKHEGK